LQWAWPQGRPGGGQGAYRLHLKVAPQMKATSRKLQERVAKDESPEWESRMNEWMVDWMGTVDRWNLCGIIKKYSPGLYILFGIFLRILVPINCKLPCYKDGNWCQVITTFFGGTHKIKPFYGPRAIKCYKKYI